MSNTKKAMLASCALHGALVVGLGLGFAGGAMDEEGPRVAFMPQCDASPPLTAVEDLEDAPPAEASEDFADTTPVDRAEDELKALLKTPSTTQLTAKTPSTERRTIAWWGEPGAWDVAWEHASPASHAKPAEPMAPATFQALWYHPPTPSSRAKAAPPASPAQPMAASPIPSPPAQSVVNATLLPHGNAPPRYPPAAARNGAEGTVWILAEIDAEGRVIRVQLDAGCGHPLLHRAALDAVGGWRFAPARDASGPIPSRARIPVVFGIRG